MSTKKLLQRDISDHTPTNEIPTTTPAELEAILRAHDEFWSSEQCAIRLQARLDRHTAELAAIEASQAS